MQDHVIIQDTCGEHIRVNTSEYENTSEYIVNASEYVVNQKHED